MAEQEQQQMADKDNVATVTAAPIPNSGDATKAVTPNQEPPQSNAPEPSQAACELSPWGCAQCQSALYGGNGMGDGGAKISR